MRVADLELRGRLVLAEPVDIVAELAELGRQVAIPARLVGAAGRVGLNGEKGREWKV